MQLSCSVLLPSSRDKDVEEGQLGYEIVKLSYRPGNEYEEGKGE